MCSMSIKDEEPPNEFKVMDCLVEMEDILGVMIETLTDDVGEEGLSYDKPIILTWKYESIPDLAFTLHIAPVTPNLIDYFTKDTMH